MPFRGFFVRIFRVFSRVLEAEPEKAEPEAAELEAATFPLALVPIGRYMYESNKFTTTRVKEGAFLPPAGLRLSVFVVDSLVHEEIIEIGRRVTNRELLAYAILPELAPVTEQGLSIERDDTPPRHAEICGWPKEKEHQKEIAQALAKAAGQPYLVVSPLV